MDKVTACDRCMHDQVRCRFNPLRQSSCRGCVALGIPCNWTRTSKPRPPPDNSYIKYLETRTKLVEAQLKNLLGVSTRKEIDKRLEGAIPGIVPTPTSATSSRDVIDANASLLGVNCLGSPALTQLVQKMRLLPVDTQVKQESQILADDNVLWVDGSSMISDEHVFHGYSSTHVLSRDAAAFQRDHSASINSSQHHPEFWKPDLGTKQPQSFSPASERAEHSCAELPPVDLMHVLLDAYFDNPGFPVIHRGLFEKQLGEGLHKHEPSFHRLLLLVCANGARWCDDPRVLDERWPVSLSAGHRWFRQLNLWLKSFLPMSRLTLWDAQSLVLATLYLCGSSETYGTWIVVGTAIRMMQDIGAHRKRPSQTLEIELHKRCFWSLLLIDRYYGVHFGRNVAMFDWDSDLDDVLEVDDDLWELDTQAPPPIQPSGVISRLSIFNQIIGLIRLYGRCLQTVYTPNRTKQMIGLGGQQGLSWVFNDINTRLKTWVRNLPPHLQLPHPQIFNNSPSSPNLIMWGGYYELVIAANRPFITRTSPLALPALKECRRAARGFAGMAAAYVDMSGSRLTAGMIHPAFSSAMILVIDLIVETESIQCAAMLQQDGAYSTQQKMADIKTCIGVLERAENRFHMAGRLRDVIQDFEGSLRVHSASRQSRRSESYTHTAEANGRNDITFDIEGPPEVSAATSGAGHQHQSQDLLGSPSSFAAVYAFADPFFQSSGRFPDHSYPSAYPTPTTTPSHTLFSETNSELHGQPSHLNQTYLHNGTGAGRAHDHLDPLKGEIWDSVFTNIT